MAEKSKTAKAATKKVVANENIPKCCGKPMTTTKMLTASGRIRGMMYLCDKCWQEQKLA